MQQISAVIITYNEARNIGRCLESLRDVADDIVVLDSFSTDATAEICHSFGVRFEQHVFDGHIEQKNRALGLARFPFVLSLDADEALSDTLRQSVLQVKKAAEIADAYTMNRLTNYCGQWIHHSGWYPDRKLRLWDSRHGQWGGTNPHDKFELQANSSTAQLKGNLLHYSFHSIEQHIEQINKFSSIAAQQLYLKGKRANAYHLLIKPCFKFFKSYVLRLGFLDGYYGYVACRNSAHGIFLRYAKLKKLNLDNK